MLPAPFFESFEGNKIKEKERFLNTLGFQNIEKFILVTLHLKLLNEQYNKEMAENFLMNYLNWIWTWLLQPLILTQITKITEVIDTCKSQYNNKLKYFHILVTKTILTQCTIVNSLPKFIQWNYWGFF